MIALHALWDNRNAGRLLVWAENSEMLISKSKKSKPKPAQKSKSKTAKKPKNHPFTLQYSQLKGALSDFKLCGIDRAQPTEISVLLPTDANAMPLPSKSLVPENERNAALPVGLAGWRTDAIAMEPNDAIKFLASIPFEPLSGIAFGSSLIFFGEAAKLSLEVVSGQRFIPAIRETENNFSACWEIAPSEKDKERMQILSGSMPPVCRALLLPDEQPPLPSDIVSGFLNKTADALIRGSMRHTSKSSKIKNKSKKPAKTAIPEQWLDALISDYSAIDADPEKLKWFSSALNSWTGHANVHEPDAPFRTCLRIEPPENNTSRNSAKWGITFHMQAKDDRSLLIPAESVWNNECGGIFAAHKFDNPEERLLASLGRAARIFPAIEAGLKASRPAAMELNAEEAYGFMRESAPLLEQSGFGIILPSWWQKPASRPSIRLKLKPDPKTSSGILGMNSILSFDWKVSVAGREISADEFEALVRLKSPLVNVRGQWVEFRQDEVERAIAFFKKRHAGQITIGEALGLGFGAEGDGGGAGLAVESLEGEGWVGDFLGRLSGSENAAMPEIKTPEGFIGELRPYQQKGLSWLAFLDRFGFGACLADDMGLGKTIQIIAFLLYARNNTASQVPSLLICPMSIVGNWQKEIRRFAPSLNVMIHHGADRLSGAEFEERAKKHDIVITTYSLACRDEEHLSKIEWQHSILDEAQNIKNRNAKQTLAIRRLKAVRRIALTGTPVENRLSELWSIMDFLNPGYLGHAEKFRKNIALPVEKYRDSGKAETLKKMLQPFVLRRLKTDKAIIKDLPEKMEMKVFCNLTKEQATLYEAVVQEMMGKIEGAEGISRKGLILAALMKLKQICNHPAQFLQDKSSLAGRSGKLERIEEMLQEALSEGDKALVFTQFAEMGKMLQPRLSEALGHEVLFLHGGTPKKARDEMIRRFQENGGPCLFILSLKAGGVGLNLMAANRVIHFDRWWNPAVENQATDRAFRIGQKKNVQVHKFICIGTVEERIDQLIEDKKSLAESIIGAGESWITEMSTSELRSMFALSRDAIGE